MYIDPAAGSMILQVVAAVALSAVAFVGRARDRVRDVFTALFRRRR